MAIVRLLCSAWFTDVQVKHKRKRLGLVPYCARVVRTTLTTFKAFLALLACIQTSNLDKCVLYFHGVTKRYPSHNKIPQAVSDLRNTWEMGGFPLQWRKIYIIQSCVRSALNSDNLSTASRKASRAACCAVNSFLRISLRAWS